MSKLFYSDHARLTADTPTNVLGARATVTDDEEGATWIDRLLFAHGLDGSR